MSDPVRLKLSADAPPLAVEALARAHGDGPDAARLVAIEAGVLGKLGLPPGGGGGGGDGGGGAGPSAPPAGPAGAAGAALTKAGLATLAAGAVIVAIAVATRSNAPVTPTTAATRSTTDASPAVATAASVAEPAPASISVDDLPAASAGLVNRAVASASARPPVSAAPAASDKDPAAATERAEVALLADAQAALTVRPAESLARCDEHARRFATGTLVQEREVLAIDALMRLGRRPEAEARANRFRAAFPRSGHLRRIDALLAP